MEKPQGEATGVSAPREAQDWEPRGRVGVGGAEDVLHLPLPWIRQCGQRMKGVEEGPG